MDSRVRMSCSLSELLRINILEQRKPGRTFSLVLISTACSHVVGLTQIDKNAVSSRINTTHKKQPDGSSRRYCFDQCKLDLSKRTRHHWPGTSQHVVHNLGHLHGRRSHMSPVTIFSLDPAIGHNRKGRWVLIQRWRRRLSLHFWIKGANCVNRWCRGDMMHFSRAFGWERITPSIVDV